MRRFLLGCAATCCLGPVVNKARGEVVLPAIFSDQMVLQRSAGTPVWGRAEPGRRITVRLGDDILAESTAAEDGRWRVTLDTRGITSGPHTLRINDRAINYVLVGEVWLCGGQSNMEFVLRDTLGAKEEISGPSNPLIRQFLVSKQAGSASVDEIQGEWMQAGPVDSGRFTAVGYHFAKELQRELGVPIGLVNATWGGSACETWMSPEAIDSLPEVSAGAREMQEEIESYPRRREAFITAFHEWVSTQDRADRRSMTLDRVRHTPEGRWKTKQLPQPAPVDDEPGSLWFRRTVDIPKPGAGQPLSLMLGTVQMLEEVWWNGETIGATTVETYETGRYGRTHQVPGSLVREGPNELLVRVWSPAKTPHFAVSEEFFCAGRVSLAGPWQILREYSQPVPDQAPPRPPVELPLIQHTASSAFNGMIAPLAPYGLAGVIWYQGENNAQRASQYHAVFPSLILDWRRLWGNDDLPFFWCQLANYREKKKTPEESAWAELREAQTKTLTLPATGQALTIDVGEAGDIHPRNKAVPGRRLAGLALARVYGRDRPAAGPSFDKVIFGEGKATVCFRQTSGGLVATPVPDTQMITSIPPETSPLRRNSPHSQLEGFAICGPDRVWHWADASIRGDDTVVVRSPQIPEPVAVRYAWADNPTVNLSGDTGLPAVPFRTDDFPLTTERKGYFR